MLCDSDTSGFMAPIAIVYHSELLIGICLFQYAYIGLFYLLTAQFSRDTEKLSRHTFIHCMYNRNV